MFKKYNQGDRFGRSGGGDRGRDSERMPMHRATCAECNQSCEVPFKPTGSRPVFCRDCFKGNQGQGESQSGGFGGRSSERGQSFGNDRNFEEKQFFDAECATCGDECTVPFKPKPGRDVYCRGCMGKKDKRVDDRNSPREERSFQREERGFVLSKDQFEMLTGKVDKILKILQGSKTYTVKEEDVALTVTPKPKKLKGKSKAKKA